MNQSVLITIGVDELRQMLQEAAENGARAVLNAGSVQPGNGGDFSPRPEATYPVNHEGVLALFGMQKLSHPSTAVIALFRKHGVEPMKQGRNISLVTGAQIVSVQREMYKKSTPFYSK